LKAVSAGVITIDAARSPLASMAAQFAVFGPSELFAFVAQTAGAEARSRGGADSDGEKAAAPLAPTATHAARTDERIVEVWTDGSC
jgi:hypothetical protein